MNGMAKRSKAYGLKMQSEYDGSDREWHGRGINDVLAVDAEKVRWVRSRMAWQRDKELLSEDTEQVPWVRL